MKYSLKNKLFPGLFLLVSTFAPNKSLSQTNTVDIKARRSFDIAMTCSVFSASAIARHLTDNPTFIGTTAIDSCPLEWDKHTMVYMEKANLSGTKAKKELAELFRGEVIKSISEKIFSYQSQNPHFTRAQLADFLYANASIKADELGN